MTTFGKNLERALKQSGMSQSDLADSLRISRSTVSRWVDETRQPPITRLVLIADALDVPVETLLPKRKGR